MTLTFDQLKLKEKNVKDLLDNPAQKYLKSDTIIALLNRNYNLINAQIDIDTGNQALVTDAIYAMSAWQAFGAYGNSISQSLQLQDIGAYRTNLAHYKEVAEQYAALINIDLNRVSTPVLNDPIAVIDTGRSLLDEDLT